MLRKVFIVFILFLGSSVIYAQNKDKSTLQKERDQLKNEISETEKILNSTRQNTKVSLGQLSLINKKLKLQNDVISSINNEVRSLSDQIYLSQLEINKMQRILDTLKTEYAKSMVYAYKNRSNYDFLNFIFSAHNFNDAIKRIAYLKSYRNYREKQGENILKTRSMIEEKITMLSRTKNRKSNVLNEKGSELNQLEEQQKEKSEIVTQLKGKQKEITKQLNEKRKQDLQLKNAISVMIKREIAAAKAEAERKEKERLEKLKKDKEIADALKKKEEEEKKKNANITKTTPEPTPEKPKVVAPPVTSAPKPKSNSVLVSSDADVTLNANFERNKGALPWPVTGYVITHYGLNTFPGGNDYYNQGVTIGAKVGESVKSVFDGEVTLVSYVNRNQVVCVKHGKYFTIYSNLESVSVQKGSHVKTGQVLGKVGLSDDGQGGSVDFLLMNEDSNVNPESWLKK